MTEEKNEPKILNKLGDVLVVLPRTKRMIQETRGVGEAIKLDLPELEIHELSELADLEAAGFHLVTT